MEPRIQYAKTADGVSIAFWSLGEGGTPLVHMPILPFSHTQLEWQIPGFPRWYERLIEKRQVIKYDARGIGLSERGAGDFSLDALVLDLEAVVNRLGLERFALFATVHAGPVAVAYSCRHPDRVSHLILWLAYATGADYMKSSLVQTTRPLMDKDWELYTETAAHAFLGWSAGDEAHRVASVMREGITPEAAQKAFAAFAEYDVAGLLPEVKPPTLVLCRREVPYPVELSTHLASEIPDAKLVLLEGGAIVPFVGDMEGVARAIDEFLGVSGVKEAVPAPTPPPASAGLVTILFTDIEGSTALTQRLGDAKARELLREHERIVREALRAHGGSEVKTLGDGFMASFGSATRALECAIAIQRAFEAWNADVGAGLKPAPTPAPEPVRVRIGLNAGEPIAEEDDLFGTAVIMAERVCGKASGGEILASNVVRELVAGKGFLFADRGDAALRGFDDPVRLYEVRWRKEGS